MTLLEQEYKLIKDKGECFDIEEVTQLVTDYFKDYDYIVGDYAYSKLRLKGFTKKENKINNSINDYQNAICECENIGLRQTLQQIRNNEESLQYDLVKIANIKGYSNPSSKAETKEFEDLKRQFQ